MKKIYDDGYMRVETELNTVRFVNKHAEDAVFLGKYDVDRLIEALQRWRQEQA